jgi:hypothetical protein
VKFTAYDANGIAPVVLDPSTAAALILEAF